MEILYMVSHKSDKFRNLAETQTNHSPIELRIIVSRSEHLEFMKFCGNPQ